MGQDGNTESEPDTQPLPDKLGTMLIPLMRSARVIRICFLNTLPQMTGPG